MDPKKHYIMCPKCGGQKLMIKATIWVRAVQDNGFVSTEEIESEDTEWDYSCPASCDDCNWYGNTNEAVVWEAPEGCLLVNAGEEITT